MVSLKDQVEALLFSSGKAMEEEQLASLTGAEKKAVKAALKSLQKEYAARDTALKLFSEGTSWKLLVKDEHVPLVRRIVADTELSRATMETLAVIAYHQPKVLQSRVVELRGGNAYEQIAELERLGFVTKEKEGRSYSLKLTERFFDYFDVEGEKGIRQVFKAVKAPQPKEKQKRLGDLEVVDALPPKTHAKVRLGPLEVVDEAEQPQPGQMAAAAEPGAQGSESAPQTAKLERDVEGENHFLEKIEKQIDELAKRNDELAQDPLFKLPEPPVTEQQPGIEQQSPEIPPPEPLITPSPETDKAQEPPSLSALPLKRGRRKRTA
jgi:segregation and condensation protein B